MSRGRTRRGTQGCSNSPKQYRWTVLRSPKISKTPLLPRVRPDGNRFRTKVCKSHVHGARYSGRPALLLSSAPKPGISRTVSILSLEAGLSTSQDVADLSAVQDRTASIPNVTHATSTAV